MRHRSRNTKLELRRLRLKREEWQKTFENFLVKKPSLQRISRQICMNCVCSNFPSLLLLFFIGNKLMSFD